MNEDLLKYIKGNKEKGFANKEIENALIGAGWQKDDIKEGFRMAGKKTAKKGLGGLLMMIGIVIVVILVGLFVVYKYSSWLDFLGLDFLK